MLSAKLLNSGACLPHLLRVDGSGVAGPLAARGGGQICRPFVLGFGDWRACLKYKSRVMSTVTLVSS